jgi:hypothetical protein
MSVFHNNALIGAGGGTAAAVGSGAVATKSLRFNRDDDAMLTRTLSSGNRRKWTWAAWIKRVQLGSQSFLFQGEHTTGHGSIIEFNSADQLDVYDFVSSYNYRVTTTRNLRDPSAWYHIVVAFDSAQSTAADRVKIYINGGSAETDLANSSYPSQNSEHYMNSAVRHIVGRATFNNSFGSNATSNVYLADIYFIDGSALDATSFGAYDSNGVWQAAAYSGTFGTNGFYLGFGDSSTDAALGTDSSGNDNTFSVHNLSVAPGLATANQGFDVVTYAGNGGTQSISGLNFQPDLVWFKGRSGTAGVGNHRMFDVVRGVQKQILPNLTNAEGTDSNTLTAFNSNGFSVGSSDAVNGSGTNYVAWCWKAGGSPSSNTDGTITSSVSVNNTYGFSIINHVGTGAAGTFGHGLSSAPDFLIFKNREATDNWFVWTRALNDTNTGGIINSTNAFFTNGVQELNQTLPTDSVIHVGNNLASNGSGQDVITYAWTEISGFSKFGKYTGNGSTDGPTVTLGFKPRFILLRSTSGSRAWCIYDTERDTSTTNDNNLFANNNSAESSDSSHNITILDNGFKLATTSVNRNGNGETYIYMAFAAKPNGAANDSLFDVPTNDTTNTDSGAGGEVSGNYAVWNPLNSANTLSNGNLTSNGAGGLNQCLSTIGMSSGKWYFEATIVDNTDNQGVGIALKPTPGTFIGNTSSGYLYYGNGTKRHSTTNTVVADSFTDGDVVGIAFDADAGNLYFYKNGVAQISGSAAFTGLTSGPYFFTVDQDHTSSEIDANFGQRSFAYTAPSGYKALCTTNLPTPTIADGSDYFQAKTYTGNGGTQSITTTGMSPDWVWTKRRNLAASHNLYDIVRGATKFLGSDTNNAEQTGSDRLTSFDSTGFSLGSNAEVNNNNDTYIAWCWDAGSSTVSNTDGSITSTVRASAASGFSIVTWTGNQTNGSVGHGLNAAPKIVFVKDTDVAYNWYVFTTATGSHLRIEGLNNTNAASSPGSQYTLNSSTVSNLSTLASLNTTGSTMLMYCIAPVEGFSSIGSYEGNGSNDGPFIFTGMRPAWIMIRASSDTGRWVIHDTARAANNASESVLYANTSDAEYTNSGMAVDILSNGFKVRTGTSSFQNGSGVTYIYVAFAENPFQANGGLAR